MRRDLDPGQRRVFNRLTTIKLALQMLDRTTAVSSYQRGLLGAALDAVDGLTADLLEQRQASADAAMPAVDSRRQRPAEIAFAAPQYGPARS